MITESDVLYVEITPDMMQYANKMKKHLGMDITIIQRVKEF